MNNAQKTIAIENKYFPSFFEKTPISIDRGEGVHVWDENGKRYMDFTSGWGVTSIGHSNPVILEALVNQSKKILQNPNSGITYSPSRARLLSLMKEILPGNLNRIFFTNSGAESNDAAMKLARKASGKMNVISTLKSFHGRTISTTSATGQTVHRNKYNPLMPNYIFVPYNDIDAVAGVINENAAAVILEPIQGEGGINLPSVDYLQSISELCAENNVYLIIDEIQTGFCRTGPMFAVDQAHVKADFLTMAKGIAGGFPFGAFAMTEEVSEKLERGDHGGTYCGNPLGCAVAYAVIRYILDNDICENVKQRGKQVQEHLKTWKAEYPGLILDIRGSGLLIAIEIIGKETVKEIIAECLERGLILNVIQGNIVRIFPALNITTKEVEEGLGILKKAIDHVVTK